MGTVLVIIGTLVERIAKKNTIFNYIPLVNNIGLNYIGPGGCHRAMLVSVPNRSHFAVFSSFRINYSINASSMNIKLYSS